MSAREFPPEVVEAAARAMFDRIGGDFVAPTSPAYIDDARAALSAAADALEGAILAPVAALVESRLAPASPNDVLTTALRGILADSAAAVANHNAAIWDEVADDIETNCDRGTEEYGACDDCVAQARAVRARNPYRTTEGTSHE
jgi:hypothetical protein